MNLPILFENDEVVVVDKPCGISVHPGAGTTMPETIVGELLKKYPSLPISNGAERPGVVHRLDKDTSGVLLITKTEEAMKFYIDCWKAHRVEKEYLVLVHGILEPNSGTIEAPITRNVKHRQKMTALVTGGKNAITHYEVIQHFPDKEMPVTFVRVNIETGRTHQIRVHFAAIKFPVIGDEVYGNRHANAYFERELGLKRQFLHACSLTFPLMGVGATAKKGGATRLKQTVESKIPSELQKVLDELSSDPTRR